MRFSLRLTLVLSATLLSWSCDDDDNFFDPPERDYCTEGIPTEDCIIELNENNISIDEFEDWLIGDWQLVARDNTNFLEPTPCETGLEDEVRFSFTADGIYRYELADGRTGSSAYVVGPLCGVVPPCIIQITYDDINLAFTPSFQAICPFGVAWLDERAVDGGLEVYERE
ncbi:MAG: hypothetical protein AAF433_15670 [Bacteroidota bacterium]